MDMTPSALINIISSQNICCYYINILYDANSVLELSSSDESGANYAQCNNITIVSLRIYIIKSELPEGRIKNPQS